MVMGSPRTACRATGSTSTAASDHRQPGVLLDGFALDRTVDGAWSVAHVEIQPDAQAALVVPLALFAGLPDYGATEYGDATVGSASSEPFARVQGDGLRGTSLLFEGFTWLPYVPAGVVFNFRPLAAPLLNGTLMVDPNGAGFRVAFSDHLGVVRSNWFVPPSTSLHGLEFDTQGIPARRPAWPQLRAPRLGSESRCLGRRDGGCRRRGAGSGGTESPTASGSPVRAAPGRELCR